MPHTVILIIRKTTSTASRTGFGMSSSRFLPGQW
jgi:hypothetical protein